MNIAPFLKLVEIRTKIISVSTVILATLYAAADGHRVSILPYVLVVSAALLVDMGTTAANSLMDYLRGVDRKEQNRETDKVLVLGSFDPTDALIVVIVLFLLAAILGTVLALVTSPLLIPAGVACIAVGLAYSVGPLPLSSTPAGELFAGGTLGTALFLIVYYVVAGTLSRDALLVSIPSTLFIASILTANNTCDIEGDRDAGRRTLSILMGRCASEAQIYLLGAAAYALLLVYSLRGVLPSISLYPTLASVPLAGLMYLSMHHTGYSHSTKTTIMARISAVFLVFTLSVATGLAWELIG